MSNTNILGLIIHVPLNLDTNAALGIYNIGISCQIRLSETPLVVVEAGLYTPGYIAKNGIGAIAHNSDFSTGGNAVHASDVNITLVNKNKYYKALLQLGVNLTGLKVQIREFIGNTVDHDSTSSDYIFTGFITDLEIDSTTISFSLKSNLAEARRSNLGTLITIESFPYAPDSNLGKILPVVFGNSDPVNGRFFKLPKTNAREEIQKVENFVSGGDVNTDYYPPTMSEFPQALMFYEGAPTAGSGIGIQVFARIGRINLENLKDQSFWNDKYMLCLAGKVDNNGKYRKITPHSEVNNNIYTILIGEGGVPYTKVINNYAYWILIDEAWELYESQTGVFEIAVSLLLENYLPVALLGNTAATYEDQAWFNILDLGCEYSTGTGIKGFYDSVTGEELTNFPELYGKNDDAIEKIFSFFCDVENVQSKLVFNPAVFNGTPKKIKSLHTMNVANFYPCNYGNLELFGETGMYSVISQDFEPPIIADYQCLGVYSDLDGGGAPNNLSFGYGTGETGTEGEYTGIDKTGDKNSLTSFTFHSKSTGAKIWDVFTFKAPKLSKGFKFKNVYLGVKMLFVGSEPDNGESGAIKLVHRGYIGRIVVDFDIITESRLNNTIIDNIPDYYYLNTVNTRDKNFYVNQKRALEITGLQNFKLDVSENDVDKFNNIEEFALILKRNFSGTNTNASQTLTINDICLIFENEQDIENEIFA